MSKNVRISLYILLPIIGWMISGQFIEEEVIEKKVSTELTKPVILMQFLILSKSSLQDAFN